MKPFKTWLEEQSLYLRIRYQPYALKIWFWLRKDVTAELNLQRNLYQSCITRINSKLIFDIGANEGFLSQLFLDMGLEVIAVEPSSRNVAILKARFRSAKKIKIIEKAVSDQIGKTHFFEVKGKYSYGTLSKKWHAIISKDLNKSSTASKKRSFVPTTTLDVMIQQYGVPDFIKIDTEGAESEVLRGLTTKVPLLSFEAILPTFYSETIANIDYLSMLDSNACFNYAVSNQLVSKSFMKKEELLKRIYTLSNQTIEIFCKMKV